MKTIYKLIGEGPELMWYLIFCKVGLIPSSQLEIFTYKQTNKQANRGRRESKE